MSDPAKGGNHKSPKPHFISSFLRSVAKLIVLVGVVLRDGVYLNPQEERSPTKSDINSNFFIFFRLISSLFKNFCTLSFFNFTKKIDKDRLKNNMAKTLSQQRFIIMPFAPNNLRMQNLKNILLILTITFILS